MAVMQAHEDFSPTPFAEVNQILRILLIDVQSPLHLRKRRNRFQKNFCDLGAKQIQAEITINRKGACVERRGEYGFS